MTHNDVNRIKTSTESIGTICNKVGLAGSKVKENIKLQDDILVQVLSGVLTKLIKLTRKTMHLSDYKEIKTVIPVLDGIKKKREKGIVKEKLENISDPEYEFQFKTIPVVPLFYSEEEIQEKFDKDLKEGFFDVSILTNNKLAFKILEQNKEKERKEKEREEECKRRQIVKKKQSTLLQETVPCLIQDGNKVQNKVLEIKPIEKVQSIVTTEIKRSANIQGNIQNIIVNKPKENKVISIDIKVKSNTKYEELALKYENYIPKSYTKVISLPIHVSMLGSSIVSSVSTGIENNGRTFSLFTLIKDFEKKGSNEYNDQVLKILYSDREKIFDAIEALKNIVNKPEEPKSTIKSIFGFFG